MLRSCHLHNSNILVMLCFCHLHYSNILVMLCFCHLHNSNILVMLCFCHLRNNNIMSCCFSQRANTEFTQAKSQNQSAASREEKLKDLAAAYDSFTELKHNLEEGTKVVYTPHPIRNFCVNV